MSVCLLLMLLMIVSSDWMIVNGVIEREDGINGDGRDFIRSKGYDGYCFCYCCCYCFCCYCCYY